MSTKAIRKINPNASGELTKVDIAERDGNGKVISSQYATKGELNTAVNNADSANNANTLDINALKGRMTTAEGGISDNATAISNEASARASAVSSEASARASADTALGGRIDSEASARASADTALGGRIDDLEDDVEDLESDIQETFQRVEEVAQGATRTFVLQASTDNLGDSYSNAVFNSENDVVEMPYGSTQSGYAVFYQMECPRGSLSDAYVRQYGLTANVLLIPEALGANEKAAVSVIPSKFSDANVQIVEIKVGDNILIKETNRPDRWLGAVDTQNQVFRFYRMEMSKVDIEALNTALAGKMNSKTIDSTPTAGNTTHLVSSAGVATALAGKQDTLTFDNAPTSNSNNPVKSGGIYTALEGKQDTLQYDNAPTANSTKMVKSGGIYTAIAAKQDDLHLTSAIIGNLTIDD